MMNIYLIEVCPFKGYSESSDIIHKTAVETSARDPPGSTCSYLNTTIGLAGSKETCRNRERETSFRNINSLSRQRDHSFRNIVSHGSMWRVAKDTHTQTLHLMDPNRPQTPFLPISLLHVLTLMHVGCAIFWTLTELVLLDSLACLLCTGVSVIGFCVKSF